MKLTFLGTGGSFGVPVVGCDCGTCLSDDPRDRRSRHGAALGWDDGTLLVDTPPELRLQLVSAGISKVSAVWFTHTHADHVHGIDDLRIFSARNRTSLPAYASEADAEELRVRFPYIFNPEIRPVPGTFKPEVELSSYREGEPVEIFGRSFLPITVPHGPVDVYGFRVGSLGYITDAKAIPPAAESALQGVRTLVINALWFERPHPTQFTIEEALAAAQKIGPERVYLTHLTHRVAHEELLTALPDGVLPAYDGLEVELR